MNIINLNSKHMIMIKNIKLKTRKIIIYFETSSTLHITSQLLTLQTNSYEYICTPAILNLRDFVYMRIKKNNHVIIISRLQTWLV